MVRAGVLGCLMAAMGAMPLVAQEARCVSTIAVEGVVSTDGGAPLPDASVIVPGLQRRLVSDAAGRFFLRNVCPGSYRLLVSHLGYGTVDREEELEAGSTLEVTLHDQAVELEGMMVEVAPVMIRLEDRRVAHGGRSAVFDWRSFSGRPVPTDIPEWVVQRTGARAVACGDDYWGTRDCFVDRMRLRRVEVCVDETESVVTPTAVSHFPREEIGRAEFYRREGLLKIYTKEFLARAAVGSWMLRSEATAC